MDANEPEKMTLREFLTRHRLSSIITLAAGFCTCLTAAFIAGNRWDKNAHQARFETANHEISHLKRLLATVPTTFPSSINNPGHQQTHTLYPTQPYAWSRKDWIG